MDSTVSRETGRDRQVPTWRDESLRQLIREFREHDFDVYLTLAFEAHEARGHSQRPARSSLVAWRPRASAHHWRGVPPDEATEGLIAPENWPWRPDHPDHPGFVAEFWETYADQAVHFARIAEEEGVRLYSLGTESDRLFRSRPDPVDPARPGSGFMHNDFGDELRSMVDRVRAVYSGRVTYDMQTDTLALLYADHLRNRVGRRSSLGGPRPGHRGDQRVATPYGERANGRGDERPGCWRRAYEAVFRQLSRSHSGRPESGPRALVFTEYHAMDVVEAPADTAWRAASSRGDQRSLLTDNRNGLDDGEETQANIFRAFFNTSKRYPGIINGAFLLGAIAITTECAVGRSIGWAGPAQLRHPRESWRRKSSGPSTLRRAAEGMR